MDGIEATHVLADRAYDTDEIVGYLEDNAIGAVIPPKRNRRVKREYDEYLYKLRHLVENAFLGLKQWRGIATRYAKHSASYLAAVHIRCITLWAKIF